MDEPASETVTDDFDRLTHNALRLALLFMILYWSFQIIAPFLPLVVWGSIIAIATYPLHEKLAARLGNRKGLSATLITLLGLTVLTLPVIVLTESVVESSANLASDISAGSISIPPPPERVQEFPIVGDTLYSNWALAAENLAAELQRFKPQLEALAESLLATAAGAGAAFLQMFFSVIVAGAFLAARDKTVDGVLSVLTWLVGDRGEIMVSITQSTVRSVFKGVLGVAIIETILAAIGLVLADVPAAGLWALLILVLSIAQIPPLLTLAPLAIYVVSTSDVVGSTLFILLSVIVVLIDTILKPVLLGRTADTPTLIVLMGALGGMILSGIVGLFVGAVVVVLGWELLQFWIRDTAVDGV
jgi:predicted PurR-regulated permease PerM